MAISVKSQSRLRFCISSVSSTAGPFLKFSDLNVTNSPRITTIDSSVKASRHFRISLREGPGSVFARKDALYSAPNPSNMLSVLSKPSSPHSQSRMPQVSSGISCPRIPLTSLLRFPPDLFLLRGKRGFSQSSMVSAQKPPCLMLLLKESRSAISSPPVSFAKP